jgi:hypothetical protein
MDKIDAYREILDVLNKHRDLLKNDHQIDIKDRVVDRISLQKISKEFGINIGSDCNPGWCKISEHECIKLYGSEHNRTISWPDNGNQPENERLYQISFPTGAYIFGRQYPENTFKMFFDELKGYEPKYIDSANNCLYFTSENAKCVHENFKPIFDKYAGLVDEELKAKKIESLKKELSKLEE